MALRFRNVSFMYFILGLVAVPLRAGPVEFGASEVQRALKERGLPESAVQFQTRIVAGRPECYAVARNLVTGSDPRGLMYGLLEAADQIRGSGNLSEAAGCPAVEMRGI